MCNLKRNIISAYINTFHNTSGNIDSSGQNDTK